MLAMLKSALERVGGPGRLGAGRLAAAVAVLLAGLSVGGGAVAARHVPAKPVAVTSASPTATANTSSTTATTTTGGASPKNLVQVVNQANGRLRVDGRVQFNQITGDVVAPVNLADAIGSCTGCQTMAVALQVNLFDRTANVFTPSNVAVAANGGCTGCTTVARAVQYNIGVDDPHAVPDRVRLLVAQMQQTLATLTASSASLADAEARVDAVIAQFQDLAAYLSNQRQAATDGGVSPSPSPSAPAGTASPTAPSSTPAATASPTVAPTATPAATPTPTPSPSPS